jgi:hypothetical protein
VVAHHESVLCPGLVYCRITSGRDPTPEEWRDARAVASLVGGEAVAHDTVGAPDGSYDFDVVLPDGRRIAVELTTPEDERRLALTKAALLPTYPVSGLARSWWLTIGVEKPTNIARLVQRGVPLLAVLEAHGIDWLHNYGPLLDQTQVQAVIDAARSVFALGASQVVALAETDSPEILFSLHGGAGGGSEQINALVEEHAGYNIGKLRAATGVVERHLFVSIPLSQSSAELTMVTLRPPPTPPVLPADLDVVWVTNWNEGKIWRTRSGGRWEALDAPPAQ